ncbi:MAG: hypothetical protein NPIRA03_23260 [Nitrospirales bacterium]|nr:MAG: hypothetical protein NPIRA03_23260 [Nitrospirales bacterium]
MFRITSERSEAGLTIKLEGRLVGPWVSEFQHYWTSNRVAEDSDTILVDLRDMISVDERGKALLRQIYQHGGTLIASGCLTKAIVEEVTIQTRHNLI